MNKISIHRSTSEKLWKNLKEFMGLNPVKELSKLYKDLNPNLNLDELHIISLVKHYKN